MNRKKKKQTKNSYTGKKVGRQQKDLVDKWRCSLHKAPIYIT